MIISNNIIIIVNSKRKRLEIMLEIAYNNEKWDFDF